MKKTPRPRINYVGQIINGFPIVLKISPSCNKGKSYVSMCHCGQIMRVNIADLKSGRVKSCGCVGVLKIKKLNLTHGSSKTPEYEIWKTMRSRCNNPNSDVYKYYGGRGIRVCKRWDSFKNFIGDMGPKPEGKSLDRIDNAKDYCPDNCRWATRTEQTQNRRNSLRYRHKGVLKTLQEWSEISGINYSALHYRFKKGADPFTPIPRRGRKKRLP